MQLSTAEFPYLPDHRIGQTVVFRAPDTSRRRWPCSPRTPRSSSRTSSSSVRSPSPHTVTTLRTGHDPESGVVTLHARERDDEAWTLHARLRRPELARPRAPRPVPRAWAS
ncbi:hypothetical protein NKH77_44750 [Streptomyces sp. M19]